MENQIVGRASHRNSRRSSILKDPSERRPLELIETNLQRRRSLKRVSFADTNTIKFDTTESLEQHFPDNEGEAPEGAPLADDTVQEDFIAKFLNLGPKAPLTGNAHVMNQTQNMDDSMEMTCSTGEVASLAHGDVTEKIATDMELTCRVPKVSKLTHSDVTEKIATDMELTCPVSKVAKRSNGDVTEKITSDMELTCSARNVDRLAHVDVTEKIATDMELTCPVSKVSKLAHGDVTEKITSDMELTCSARNVDRLALVDVTEKIATDMESTCPVAKVTKLVHGNVTKKKTSDMELTCPVPKVAKLVHGDVTEQIATDMELTCPVSQVGGSQSDMTGNMEMTCLAGEMTKKITKDKMIYPTDSLQTITTDVEKVAEDDPIQKTTASEEVFCKAGQTTQNMAGLTQDKLVQGITANKEVTPSGNLVQKKVTEIDTICPAFTQDGTQVEAAARSEEGASSPFRQRGSGINFPLPVFQSISSDEKDCRLKEEGGGDVPSNSIKHRLEYSEGVGDVTKNAPPIPFVPENVQSQLGGKTLVSSAEELPLAHSGLFPSSPAQAGSPSYSQSGAKNTSPSSEELLDDINLSLVNEEDDSSEASPSGASGSLQRRNRRKSMVAEAVDKALPLINSFMERLSEFHTSCSDLEAHLRETSSTEQLGASVSFQYKNNSLTPKPPNDFEAPELCPSHAQSITDSRLDSLAPQMNVSSNLAGSNASKMEGSPSRIGGNDTQSDGTLTEADCKPPVQPVCTQGDHRDVRSEMTISDEEQPCSKGCCLGAGSNLYAPSGRSWTVREAHEGRRRLGLNNSALELNLSVVDDNSHWRVSSAAWSPQASEVSNICGRLVLKVLSSRMESTVCKLNGLLLCNIGDALAKVSSVYQDIFKLIVELQILKSSYLTLFMEDRLKVTLFSVDANVSVDVLVQLRSPIAKQDLYTLHPSATITIGNLRYQTIDEAIARVGSGPKHLTRLVQAVDFVVQNMKP